VDCKNVRIALGNIIKTEALGISSIRKGLNTFWAWNGLSQNTTIIVTRWIVGVSEPGIPRSIEIGERAACTSAEKVCD
jgi:hypothetical protein